MYIRTLITSSLTELIAIANTVSTMILYGSIHVLFVMGTCFMAVMSIDPHPQVKGN